MNTDKTQKVKNTLARIALYPAAAIHYTLSPITYAFARKNIGGVNWNQFAKLGFDLANEATAPKPTPKTTTHIAMPQINALIAHINRCKRVTFKKELETIEGQMSYKITLDNTCVIRGLCDMTNTAPVLVGDIRPQTAKIFIDGTALGDSCGIKIGDMTTLHTYITPAVMGVYKRMKPMDKIAACKHADDVMRWGQEKFLNACAANAKQI